MELVTAHRLDTGLLVAQRTRIRDEIATKLEPLLRSSGLYLSRIHKLGGVVRGPGDDDGLAELLDAMVGSGCMIGIACGRGVGGANGVNSNGDRNLKTIEVHVYVSSDNARGKLARMAQDVVSVASLTSDPGIEMILEHVDQELHGFVPPSAVGANKATIYQLQFVDEDEVWHVADRTIWQVRYRVNVERNANRHRDVTTVLTGIRTLHHVDGAEPQNPLITSDTEIEP